MTDFIIKPSQLAGSLKINIPPSKSQTLRAILFASLAEEKSILHNYLQSTDSEAMISACQELGAKIQKKEKFLEIIGCGGKIKNPQNVIDAKNSGIVLRFLTAVASLNKGYTIITGDESLRNRPMQPLIDALNQCNVFCVSANNNGKAPIIIRGPIKSLAAEISGEDSQYVSSLLIIASLLEGTSAIKVKNPKEIPWVNLTLTWLDKLNIKYKNCNFEYFEVEGNSKIKGFEYSVPSDFSSAAFAIVAALLSKTELVLENMDMEEPQGDKMLIYLLQEMGANIDVLKKEKKIIIKKSYNLIGKTIDVDQFIDLVPILAVLGCFVKGGVKIINAAQAKNKESNRLEAITSELKKMQGKILQTADGLIIQESILYGAELESFSDHRIAMSLAIAAMHAKGNSVIKNIECINKTYPSFKADFIKIGADIV